RREAGAKTLLRMAFDNQILRFSAALSPFLIAMLIWPEFALPIAQAPVPMLIVVGFVELRVLRLPLAKRKDVCTEAEAARAFDALAFRARKILADIAARRGVATGELHLVVDQSDLVRVAPLTVVSVQTELDGQGVFALDEGERALIRETLFDDDFTERQLHLANTREGKFMRSVAFDARGVTAHARLAAILDKPPPVQKSGAPA
ncbi:MAG: hypothetical protein AAFU55_10260, partial [Pseudomonadota bacterium]